MYFLIYSLSCPTESFLSGFTSENSLPVAILVSLDALWTRGQTGRQPECFTSWQRPSLLPLKETSVPVWYRGVTEYA